MKKIVTIGIGCLLSLSLSGCSLGSVIDRFTASDDAAIQDINPEITRVYMDEIRGELQNFTGNLILLTFRRQLWNAVTACLPEMLSASYMKDSLTAPTQEQCMP